MKKTTTLIDYTAGVYQGDNMSRFLFLFIVQGFLDSLKLNAEKAEFSFPLKIKMTTCKHVKADSWTKTPLQEEELLRSEMPYFNTRVNLREKQVNYKNTSHTLALLLCIMEIQQLSLNLNWCTFLPHLQKKLNWNKIVQHLKTSYYHITMKESAST